MLPQLFGGSPDRCGGFGSFGRLVFVPGESILNRGPLTLQITSQNRQVTELGPNCKLGSEIVVFTQFSDYIFSAKIISHVSTGWKLCPDQSGFARVGFLFQFSSVGIGPVALLDGLSYHSDLQMETFQCQKRNKKITKLHQLTVRGVYLSLLVTEITLLASPCCLFLA